MGFIDYVVHYFKMPDSIVFFLLTVVLIIGSVIILSLYAKAKGKVVEIEQRKEYIAVLGHSLIERFYELIFSGTSILLFMTTYYLIERFLETGSVREIWDKYHDFWLLLIIVISCVFNRLLDKVFIRLKNVDGRKKASIRLIGMLYMVMIFCYVKFIYENNNYDVFITYFLGLMIGRFVYFDTSFRESLATISYAIKNIPLMLLALFITAILSIHGFGTKFLLIHNGVITNVFVAHLFMCVAIFVIHHLHIARLMCGNNVWEVKDENI